MAITAEALTAALSAGRRSLHWTDVCLLGSITALEGGTVREALLGHYPLSWVAQRIRLAGIGSSSSHT